MFIAKWSQVLCRTFYNQFTSMKVADIIIVEMTVLSDGGTVTD